MEDSELIYDKVMDGESLAKEVMEHHGSVTDENGKSYWWNTIDRTKTYRVKKYEYERALQYYEEESKKMEMMVEHPEWFINSSPRDFGMKKNSKRKY